MDSAQGDVFFFIWKLGRWMLFPLGYGIDLYIDLATLGFLVEAENDL